MEEGYSEGYSIVVRHYRDVKSYLLANKFEMDDGIKNIKLYGNEKEVLFMFKDKILVMKNLCRKEET